MMLKVVVVVFAGRIMYVFLYFLKNQNNIIKIKNGECVRGRCQIKFYKDNIYVRMNMTQSTVLDAGWVSLSSRL